MNVPLALDIAFDLGQGNVTRPERGGIYVLAALLLSFLFIRTSTRLMRSPKVPWWPGSVRPGGLHIHHLVFGIVLLLVAGFLQFAFEAGSPWFELLAIAFGIGAGLTLDEFALWLRLEDVYWAEQGRESVDAVIVAVMFAALVMLGLAPLDASGGGSITAAAATITFNIVWCVLAIGKGRYWLGLAGVFVPFLAIFGAVRLARPKSPWARRFYGEDSDKMRRARERERRREERIHRFQDILAGRPGDPETRADDPGA